MPSVVVWAVLAYRCVGGVLAYRLCWGGGEVLLLLLSLLIHDGLYGWAGSFCTEQNHTAKPNFMLSIYHFDDSGPDSGLETVWLWMERYYLS